MTLLHANHEGLLVQLLHTEHVSREKTGVQRCFTSELPSGEYEIKPRSN